MKQTIRTIMFIAAAVIMLTACSGNNKTAKADSISESTQSEVSAPASDELDVEKINKLADDAMNGKYEPTKEDYDFILDQLEILANKNKSMGHEAFSAYMHDAPDAEAAAIFFICMTGTDADSRHRLTTEQSERFKLLEPYIQPDGVTPSHSMEDNR